jgi:hypothetical protein
MQDLTPISVDRPLTAEETSLVEWLLEHGDDQAAEFLPQLYLVRVISRCPCGCASIDFGVSGQAPATENGLQVLSDYQWETDEGAHCGVFVFAGCGFLAGLEVWSIDGQEATPQLPKIERLRPITFARKP